jgi:glycosyltransferase involved in cell wall biosynthesis
LPAADTRPRLLLALTYYYPYVSGISEYARLIAEALVPHFHVTVLTGRHRAGLPDVETVNGVEIVRAAPLVFLHKGYLSAALVRKFRALARRADVVNLHVPMLEAGLFARLTPRGVPLVVTDQCDLAITDNGLDQLAVRAVRASARIAMARADAVAVLSRDYAAGSPLVARFASKTHEIFPPVKDTGAVMRLTRTGPPRVGFLGRFVKEKGIDVLLAAIPLVQRAVPEVQFVLAGEFRRVAGGGMYDEIEHTLAGLSNVHVEGSIEPDALGAFYSSLDLLVLPSINAYEAFGMVQVEAMSAGVPVVASDLRGVRVPIARTGSGILVSPGDAEQLARGIIEALRRTWDREAIRRTAHEVFSTERATRAYRTLYEQLFGVRRAA